MKLIEVSWPGSIPDLYINFHYYYHDPIPPYEVKEILFEEGKSILIHPRNFNTVVNDLKKRGISADFKEVYNNNPDIIKKTDVVFCTKFELIYVGLTSDNLKEPPAFSGYSRSLCKDNFIMDSEGLTNSKPVQFNTALIDWGNLTRFFLTHSWDSSAKILWSGPLNFPHYVGAGDKVLFRPHSIRVCFY